MKHINTFLSLAAGLAFAATSCVNVNEINEMYRPAGTPIVFSASSGYQNGIETRAEYSGYYYGSPAYERIDWVANDPVKIVYNGTPSSYQVASVSGTTNEISDATLSSGSLTWEDSATHVFYGLYPSGAVGSSGTLTNAGLVSGSIPAIQNITSKVVTDQDNITKYQPDTEHYGYLVAYKEIASSSTESSVVLPFRPAVTTFEFKFQRLAVDTYPNNIQSFTLSTEGVGSAAATPLYGNFQFQITGGDAKGATWGAVTTSSTGNSITVGFGSGGVAIPSTGYLDFSILALPVDITGATMTVTYVGGSTKSLKLKTDGGTNWYTFTGAKKYVITNTVPGDRDYEYIIEEIDDITTYGHLAASLGIEVKSYRRNTANNAIEAVSWKAQYWDGSDWRDWTTTQGDFSLSSSYTGNGVSSLSNHENRAVGLTINTHTESVQKTSTEILREATPVTNYDLSMHDVFGNERDEPTTANSYVISAPGTYRFPCVYGNAITNGDTNYESFAPGGSNSSIKSIYSTYVNDTYDTAMGGLLPIRRYPDVNYVPIFRNAINKEITNPYIIDDINSRSGDGYTVSSKNVALVWQDEQILTNSDLSLITVNGHDYIQVTISDQTIQPGNIVVALRGAAGGDYTDTKTILWSWHLWITERDLTPIEGIMPSNLGWNKIYNGSQKYTDRTLPIRLIQIAPADDPTGAIDNEPFTVTQFGDSEDLGENVGSNPYYQWGRKDPMIPGCYDPAHPNIVGEPCADRTIYPGPDYSNINSDAILIATTPQLTSTVDYGTAIRNPHKVYVAAQNNIGSTSWIAGYIPTWATITGDGGRTGGVFQGTRKLTAIPYNLWNAYCYGYGAPGTNWSSSTKFKTVYDPCPPGFTVPHRGLEDILGAGSDTPDHSGKNFTMSGGSVLFLPYMGGRIFYNVTGVIPGTSVTVPTPGLYLRHVAGSSNTFGLYWTDCPSQFTNTTPNLPQPNCFELQYYWYYPHSQMYLFTSSNNDTMDYTKGTAGAIRPMVDPRY